MRTHRRDSACVYTNNNNNNNNIHIRCCFSCLWPTSDTNMIKYVTFLQLEILMLLVCLLIVCISLSNLHV